MTAKSILILPALLTVLASSVFAGPMTNHKMTGHMSMKHGAMHVAMVGKRKHHHHHKMAMTVIHHSAMKPMGGMHHK